jgi:hypothetical protein
MQTEKATGPVGGAVVVGAVEEATRAAPGERPPPQPAASEENAAIATIELMMTAREPMLVPRFGRVEKAHHASLSMRVPTLRDC